jgi:CheY-like chemotaxis protein
LSMKILVVEDSFDLRELLGIGLASRGWAPILAESGRESLAKLACETPSVILMDMGLPDMNGYELAAILKRHRLYRMIPILGTTGYPGGVARERCLAAGCDDFISKPFAFAALHTRLTRLVPGERPSTTVEMDHETLIEART